MAHDFQEIEAKFYVRHLSKIEARLKQLGGRLIQPRTFEVNLRFDTPQGELRHTGRVLRLRRDQTTQLTYKSASLPQEGALERTEIEFSISDFDAAQQFLQALGYQVCFIYEKYRTTFALAQAHIMLDELPYGNFVEIEGDLSIIKHLAEQLGLRWEAAIQESYSKLFESIQQKQNLPFRDLRFEHFKNITISADQLGVKIADEAPD